MSKKTIRVWFKGAVGMLLGAGVWAFLCWLNAYDIPTERGPAALQYFILSVLFGLAPAMAMAMTESMKNEP